MSPFMEPSGEVLTPFVQPIRDLVFHAARRSSTASFRSLFDLFPKPTPATDDIWATLDLACSELASLEDAIYSAVMGRKYTDLPGDGFFDIFRIYRRDAYQQIAGEAAIPGLSVKQRKAMAESERAVVYAHAAKSFGPAKMP